MRISGIVLFDSLQKHRQLQPLTLTRPIAELRIGALRMRQKWEYLTGINTQTLSLSHIQAAYPAKVKEGKTIYLRADIFPNTELWRAAQDLPPQTLLEDAKGEALAFAAPQYFESIADLHTFLMPFKRQIHKDRLETLDYVWDIFQKNRTQILWDFDYLVQHRPSENIRDKHSRIYGKDNIFAEPGAQVRAAVLNAEDGPIYLSAHSRIEEGAIIKGALALGAHASIMPGAIMRGDSSIGAYAKVGGEVSNSVFIGYSNKAHDGFLGNAVIGEWCNLGAGTTSSNLKNNYGNLKIWDYASAAFVQTHLQFCGLIMGDHSKTAIQSSFNTATVVGVGANIFGAQGFPPKFIPSFAWGVDAHNFQIQKLDKFFETAERVMQRRNRSLNQAEKNMLEHIFNESKIHSATH
ncbi:MAG: glucose-1-phosphate thymidylyltransferase [Bernardetiaceae bacterium]|nr:glucose-1-phosphate thymidylyltransferase [Bernardetiaceae bacterium]